MYDTWIVRRTQFTVVCECGDERKLQVVLQWSPSWPQEVQLVFPRTTWRVGRELLRAGLETPSGLDDVQVMPDFIDDRYVELYLCSDDGRIGFRIWRETLADFLVLTYSRVPAGIDSP